MKVLQLFLKATLNLDKVFCLVSTYESDSFTLPVIFRQSFGLVNENEELHRWVRQVTAEKDVDRLPNGFMIRVIRLGCQVETLKVRLTCMSITYTMVENEAKGVSS